MRTILLFFDSLNRRYLSPYGCEWVKTPNFDRLAKHTVKFKSSYVGSMPCIPARRDLHTGRLNFLHRCWGPIEPYDESFIETLKSNGVYTHLISDHMHYWEDGGANYHGKYNSWEVVRGQEGDPWKAKVGFSPDTHNMPGRKDKFRVQDIVNRAYFKEAKDYPISKVFDLGLEFLRENADEDNWLLQIESFDPHEPFNSHEKYHSVYPDPYEGPQFDWPDYKRVNETDEEIQHIKYRYASLVSACDEHLGRVLDFMDSKSMWKDTILIVCTDHGYLLGEHGWWAKSRQPLFNEIANTPFFIWDPRYKKQDESRDSIVQLIDIAPTLLEAYDMPIPKTVEGVSLSRCLENGSAGRDYALFGIHGCHVNITDGRYVYMRAPEAGNKPLYDYTLMPADMRSSFNLERLRHAELSEPFSFTKELKLLKVPAEAWSPINFQEYGTLLFDLNEDPHQLNPIKDKDIEEELIKAMIELMKRNDAPEEQYARLGLKE